MSKEHSINNTQRRRHKSTSFRQMKLLRGKETNLEICNLKLFRNFFMMYAGGFEMQKLPFSLTERSFDMASKAVTFFFCR